MAEQLGLLATPRSKPSFDNFQPGENTMALLALQNPLPGQAILLVGEGAGVSHLLQASVAKGNGILITKPTPEALNGHDGQALIAVDNLQEVHEDPIAQQALFHAFNRWRENGSTMIFGAKSLPETFSQLPDLTTRLRWGLVFEIAPLNRQEKQKYIVTQLSAMGLLVDDKFVSALSRYSMPQIAAAVSRAQRAIATEGRLPRSARQLVTENG